MGSKKNTARKYAETAAEECMGGRMKAMGRMVDNIYDSELKSYGITVSQFGLLSAILLMEEATPSQLVERMCIEKSTLSRNLKLIEEATDEAI